MGDISSRRMWALLLAAGLVGFSFVGPRIPMRWRVPTQAGLAGVLVLLTRAPLGLRPPAVWAGLRLGLTSGAVAATAVAAVTSAPLVRSSMAGRVLPRSAPIWLLWQIPLGTVWAEEAGFRAALGSATRVFGARRGRLTQAAAFGLSHIADARASGEPVAPTVVATAVVGWVFGWLAERSGSLAAPILAHLAINETAAVAALAVQRRPGYGVRRGCSAPD
ncbi:CPBP family intramembrane glutamic endopeptidase [Mycobacterium sp.]|uniref:Rv0804 family intramembrane glutamic endopeptidase n=1 Tax=Mycobacterium sp. TaxID=1785 RepID=UPI00127CE712|nr:CPBP family intramembrane glutamic endopeptidase [Mycobacterium sp.]KAA8961538.1 MAG: CPBP family intramembrane metalloprotease [Mycobacterium sp.]